MRGKACLLWILAWAGAAHAADSVAADAWTCQAGDAWGIGATETEAAADAQRRCAGENACGRAFGCTPFGCRRTVACRAWACADQFGQTFVASSAVEARDDARQACAVMQAQLGFALCTQVLNCLWATIECACADPCGAQTWYRDSDGDGWGAAPVTGDACSPPGPGVWVRRGSDCDDGDPAVNPDVTVDWWRDEDGDGFGAGDVLTLDVCNPPQVSGWVRNDDDCDDARTDHHPGAVLTFYRDADGDGFGDPAMSAALYACDRAGWVGNARDCDDGDATLNPRTLWYPDGDGDGEGARLSDATRQCAPPAATGWARAATDCNDQNRAINSRSTWYRDADGDGDGDPGATVVGCEPPAGYVWEGADCDDTDPALHGDTAWYVDEDGDGFGGAYLGRACAPIGDFFWGLCAGPATPVFVACPAAAFLYDECVTLPRSTSTARTTLCPHPAERVTRVPGDADDHDAAVNLDRTPPSDADGDGAFSLPGARFALPFTMFRKVAGRLLPVAADCDDRTRAVGAGTRAWLDLDRDGLGDPRRPVVRCAHDRLPVAAAPDDADDGRADVSAAASLRAAPGRAFHAGDRLCALGDDGGAHCLAPALALYVADRALPLPAVSLDGLRLSDDPRARARLALSALVERHAGEALGLVLDVEGQRFLAAWPGVLYRDLPADCVTARGGVVVANATRAPLRAISMDRAAFGELRAALARTGAACSLPRRPTR